MTLPSSGPISLADIQTEFGGSNPISLSEYYKSGLYVSAGATAPNVPTSGLISISNFYGASAVPTTYSFNSINYYVYEGSSVTLYVTTTSVPNGTTLYWSLIDPGSDITTDSGSFIINSNAGNFSITALSDINYYEGTENFTVSLRTDSTSGTVRDTTTLYVYNVAPAPIYSISESSSSVSEGSSVSFSISTSYVEDGTTLYWTTAGDVSAVDFSDFINAGSVTVSGGSASVSRTLRLDSSTEGTESFYLELRTGSTSGSIVASSGYVGVGDTSIASYSISPSSGNASEGVGSVTFTVSVTSGTAITGTYSWEIAHSGTTSADFSSDSGTFYFNGSSGSFDITPYDDIIDEGTNDGAGAETFYISVYNQFGQGVINFSGPYGLIDND